MPRWGLVRAATVSAAVAGCTSFGSTAANTPPAAPDATPDAAVDAAPDAAVDGPPDAGVDAASGVLATDDFENGVVGAVCSDWSPNNATGTLTATGHGGARSCRLCATAGGTTPFVGKAFPSRGSGVYSLTFYVRRDADAVDWTGELVAVGEGGTSTQIGSNGGALTDSWELVQVNQRTALEPLSMMAYVIPKSGGCLDFDDVVISYAP